MEIEASNEKKPNEEKANKEKSEIYIHLWKLKWEKKGEK